ncbi:MAG TPA: hypothetical protein VGB50_04155 [Flavobacterium sp.]|jgi:hypothetical protein
MENENQQSRDQQNQGEGEMKMNKRGGETLHQNEWHDQTDTDKYLSLEQPGVTYTPDTNPTNYSDYQENGEQTLDTWSAGGHNSRNADAFNQDDYILNDNIDVDEDQNTSISSEDNDK